MAKIRRLSTKNKARKGKKFEDNPSVRRAVHKNGSGKTVKSKHKH